LSIDVTLKYYEVMQAANIGIMRAVSAMNKGEMKSFGSQDRWIWQRNVEGAIGEYIISKHLNIYWAGMGQKCGFDVGTEKEHHEVRFCANNEGEMVIRNNDKDDYKYWFVTGARQNYKIHGWIYAKEGKLLKYEKAPQNRPPAFFVPQNILRMEN